MVISQPQANKHVSWNETPAGSSETLLAGFSPDPKLESRWHSKCCLESMQKTTVQSHSILTLILAAISAKLHSLLESAAPVGYQDDSGFHLGVQRKN